MAVSVAQPKPSHEQSPWWCRSLWGCDIALQEAEDFLHTRQCLYHVLFDDSSFKPGRHVVCIGCFKVKQFFFLTGRRNHQGCALNISRQQLKKKSCTVCFQISFCWLHPNKNVLCCSYKHLALLLKNSRWDNMVNASAFGKSFQIHHVMLSHWSPWSYVENCSGNVFLQSMKTRREKLQNPKAIETSVCLSPRKG